jgi:site-specific recombinase XerD
MRKQAVNKKGQASFSGKSPILPPHKPKNADVRPREYLTEEEAERLIDAAASQGRHGHRDATMILLTYRDDLRVSELVTLCCDMLAGVYGKPTFRNP